MLIGSQYSCNSAHAKSSAIAVSTRALSRSRILVERRKSPRLDGHRPQQCHEVGAAGTVGKPLRNDG
jgi:hypothetical protein